MSRGMDLNNPFDLEVSQSFKWHGEIRPSSDKVFCQFDTLLDGVRAGLKDLRNQQTVHGLNNWTDIITKYAPPSENDTSAYIMAMCKGTGTYPKDYINLSDPTFLALAGKCVMIQEQGYNPCTDELLTQAVNEVLGITPDEGETT